MGAVALYQHIGDDYGVILGRWDLACTLRLLGRLDEAREVMAEIIPQIVRVADPSNRTLLADDYAALLADLGHNAAAARVIGAADARREQDRSRRDTAHEAQLVQAFTNAREALPADVWDREYQIGAAMTVEDALTAAHAAESAHSRPNQRLSVAEQRALARCVVSPVSNAGSGRRHEGSQVWSSAVAVTILMSGSLARAQTGSLEEPCAGGWSPSWLWRSSEARPGQPWLPIGEAARPR
jgi:hypothetical protein